jgi:hypothetical protein
MIYRELLNNYERKVMQQLIYGSENDDDSIRQLKIVYYRDNWKLRYPDTGATKLIEKLIRENLI